MEKVRPNQKAFYDTMFESNTSPQNENSIRWKLLSKTMKTKLLLLLLVFVPLFGFDRITKQQALAHLKNQDIQSFFSGFLNFTYHENTGAMLSLGEKLPEGLRFIAFTVMVGLVLLAVLIYLMSKPMDEYTFIAGALIFTGGSGNLYDRVLNDGRVVDFILLRLGPVQTGVFNVADMLIMIGVLAVLFLTTTLGQRLISYFRPFWLVRS